MSDKDIMEKEQIIVRRYLASFNCTINADEYYLFAYYLDNVKKTLFRR